MTEQHECNYCFGVRLTSDMVERLRDPARVKCDYCDNALSEDEILSRLNEYETLKRATEALPVDEHFRWFADKVEEAPNLDELEQRAWADCLRAYADILEKEK